MSRHSSRLKNTVCGMEEHQTRYVTMHQFVNTNYYITQSNKTQRSYCVTYDDTGQREGCVGKSTMIYTICTSPMPNYRNPVNVRLFWNKTSIGLRQMHIAISAPCNAPHNFPLLDTLWHKQLLQITLTLESTTFPLNAIACCCTCCFIAKNMPVCSTIMLKAANPHRWVGDWLHLAANQRHKPARSPLVRTRFTSSQAAFVGPNKSLSRGCTWQVGIGWVAVNITAIFVLRLIKAMANRWVNSTKDM